MCKNFSIKMDVFFVLLTVHLSGFFSYHMANMDLLNVISIVSKVIWKRDALAGWLRANLM